ncbi:hypothetical protein KJ761_02235, partial [Patescibacteria group bacterium]|nr:hypothetical protein [Patescibacteria group bacterium]
PFLLFFPTFLCRKKSYKRTLSPTADLDKFKSPSLKLLIFAPQKDRAKLFNTQSTEFVSKSSVRLKDFKSKFPPLRGKTV